MNYAGKCQDVRDIAVFCLQLLGVGQGCAICNIGYYRTPDLLCDKCDISCSSCIKAVSCRECASGFYLTQNYLLCQPQENLLNCSRKSKSGCLECDLMFFKNEFDECDECVYGCSSCGPAEWCTACVVDFVLINNQCLVCPDTCTGCSDGACTGCVSGYKIYENRNICEKKNNLWWLYFVSAVLFLLIIVLLIVFAVLVYKIHSYMVLNKFKRQNRIFKTKKVKVPLNSLSGVLMVSKQVLTFNSDTHLLPLNKESKDYIIVANATKGKIKVQFSSKKDNYRFFLESSPKVVQLSAGECCEFHIRIKPLCTTTIRDTIQLVSLEFSTALEQTHSITLDAVTQIGTLLDPAEIQIIEQVGEGGFAVVYRGIFKEMTIAMKKMRTMNAENFKGYFLDYFFATFKLKIISFEIIEVFLSYTSKIIDKLIDFLDKDSVNRQEEERFRELGHSFLFACEYISSYFEQYPFVLENRIVCTLFQKFVFFVLFRCVKFQVYSVFEVAHHGLLE